MSDKTLTRIAALLRKAESTDNPHEADAFLQAAQRLATLASVDLAVARSHAASKERRATPTQREVLIGESGKRGLRTYVELYLSIARANDIRCDIARDSTRVFAYGFDADLDTVAALYQSLVIQMVRASDEFIKSGRYAEELVERWSESRRRYEIKPVHPVTARVNFQRAFAYRIGQAALRGEDRRHAGRRGRATDGRRRGRVAGQGDRDLRPVPVEVAGSRSLAGFLGVRRLLRARQPGRRPRRPHRPPRRRGRDRRFPHEHLAMTLDDQRSRVYAAEDLAARILDRSAEHPVLEVAGSRITLPVERRFGDVAAVQRYADAVLDLDWVRVRWPTGGPPADRPGATRRVPGALRTGSRCARGTGPRGGRALGAA